MNQLSKASILFCVVTFFAATASAAPAPSVAHGKGLFGNSSLGTNGKSCATCHPSGTGLEESASSADKELEQITNKCIEKALKGKPLAVGSLDLSSIVLYLKSIGQTKAK